MNTDHARINMFKQQLRTWGVLDEQIIRLFANLPREQFVPTDYQQLAYADTMIQIKSSTMLPPKEQGRMLQALNIKLTDNILEIGTSTGFMTTLLAKLGQTVYSIDNNPELSLQAEKNLTVLHITNAHLSTGDVAKGLPEQAPFDIIMINGSLPTLPRKIKSQLVIGGRICAIIGNSPVMQAKLITRTSEQNWPEENLFETDRPRLAGIEEPAVFEF